MRFDFRVAEIPSRDNTLNESSPNTARSPQLDPPKWAHHVLLAAAIYNLIWGAWVVMRPSDFFNLAHLELPRYPEIWQCVGMVVGVYGIGYAIAAKNPARHWPIVLVGFLGKTFGPIGIAWNLATGSLSMEWVWLTIFNDLIWLFPFAAILFFAFDVANRPHASPTGETLDAALLRFASQRGETLRTLSSQGEVLVVFLRHFGCTFCREALDDLRQQRAELERQGITLVLVHMGDNTEQATFFDRYGLDDVHRISDPSCHLYQAFGLQRGGPSQLFPPGVWWRGFQAAIVNRHGFGNLIGDGFQMPGTFLLKDGRIVKAYRHKTSGSRPNYCDIAITPLNTNTANLESHPSPSC
ncbi:peroxiredoxin-like family protein [Rhodopirellula sp. MGV]|uniref:peroxiredoxin-like family protein n=1 Tax=Rhodopirellula sp. MGV TaxID=2023130 RepID=UPI000B969949|nr:peroxiredoxin-like family protein [Rhodopirellula sp. MGV]OYP32989.1 hypothetical protein CGZ80_19025 [Rhodopirellula sp. MGV]